MSRAIIKGKILTSLRNTQRLFEAENRSRHLSAPLSLNFQLPKLAVLELAGWVEQTQDRIVIELLRKQNVPPTAINEFIAKIVEKNYGFTYDKFRSMLISAVGIQVVAYVEDRNPTLKQSLSSRLGTLNALRRDLAHTLERSSATVPTPKTTETQHFTPIFNDLVSLRYELIQAIT